MDKNIEYIDINDIRNLSKSEILRLIYSYSKFMPKDPFRKEDDADNLFKYIIDLMGYSGFPKVVPDEKFKKLETREYYRGVRELEHFANYLCDVNYHYGTGYVNGTFAATEKLSANEYTSRTICYTLPEKNEKIMTIKLDNAKICNEKDIKYYFNILAYETFPEIVWAWGDYFKNKLSRYKNSINESDKNVADWIIAIKYFMLTLETEKEQKRFLQMFDVDTSKLAILLGYDAMDTGNDSIVIFNRGKVIVSQSELERVTKNSTKYNPDQTVNFETQPE